MKKETAAMACAAAILTITLSGIATAAKEMDRQFTLSIPYIAVSSTDEVQTIAKVYESDMDKPQTVRHFSDEEKEMLLKIAMAEAEGESVEGKALVMLTVLNRAEDPAFPDSIQEVIFQKNQFSPVSNGRYDRVEPNEGCYEALELVESGWNESEGALYFESCSSSDNWHSRNLTFLFRSGNHNFYR